MTASFQYITSLLFLASLNMGNNVTGIKVLNSFMVSVESGTLSTSKDNGRSNSISEQTLKISTVSDISDDAIIENKDEIKEGDNDKEEKVVVVGEIVVEGAVDDTQELVADITTNDEVEEAGENVGSVVGEGEGGRDDVGSHKKRKRSKSCVDETINLPAIEKEQIDDVIVTDANDVVLTPATEAKSAIDLENKAPGTDSTQVTAKKDESKLEKSRVEVEKSKSIAIISAPIVRSFPVRQSALTDR